MSSSAEKKPNAIEWPSACSKSANNAGQLFFTLFLLNDAKSPQLSNRQSKRNRDAQLILTIMIVIDVRHSNDPVLAFRHMYEEFCFFFVRIASNQQRKPHEDS